MEEELEKKPSSLVTLCRWSSVVLDGQETNDLAPKGSPGKLGVPLIKSEGHEEADRNGNANTEAYGGSGDTPAAPAPAPATTAAAESVGGRNGVQGAEGVEEGAAGATSVGNADAQHHNQFQCSQNCSNMEARSELEACFLIPKGQLLG